MKIVVAVDSFKGSLESLETGRIISEAIKKVQPNADVNIFPLADGGEGTCKTLTVGLGGKIKTTEVTSPLGEKIQAEFGEIPKKNLAIIEIASAAGLTLVPENLKNPLNTTTYGVGELILDAIKDGCRDFLVGLGGSATNDGGIGMLNALGFKFKKESGEFCGIFGKDLELLHSVECDKIIPQIRECKFRIACDVKNPLTGEKGCSKIYAPQKGANENIVLKMDDWLKNFAKITAKTLNLEKFSVPGDGAAGGLGYAFRTYLNGELLPGVELVLDALNISEELANADFLITGEGRLDGQTSQGKAPTGVANFAKKINPKISVIAIGGSVAENFSDANIDAAFSILREPLTLQEAVKKENAEKNLRATVEEIFKLIKKIGG